MKILVHEFGGYPFPFELSRELASRGHAVTHSWCASLIDTAGPAGELARRPDNPETLEFAPLDLGEPLDKYKLLKRRRQERLYGRLAAALTESVEPQVVLAADVPLDAQRLVLDTCDRLRIPFVFWLQDLIGIGTRDLLAGRLPMLGGLVGRHYTRLEARLLRRSAAVVPITDDFLPFLDRSRVDSARVTTIENWAPLSELPERPKDNAWAREAGLADRFVFAYTGAIGMKQDRELMLKLAAAYRDRDAVRVLVVSGGPEADYLRRSAAELGLDNLVVRDFVPWELVPDVMGAADVLLASIHLLAGAYSVPSKVLAYLCAGRPLLVSVPEQNLAGQIVAREGAGLVAPPGNYEAFLAAAERLLGATQQERATMGAAGRHYAESNFAIGAIADRFEQILTRVAEAGR